MEGTECRREHGSVRVSNGFSRCGRTDSSVGGRVRCAVGGRKDGVLGFSAVDVPQQGVWCSSAGEDKSSLVFHFKRSSIKFNSASCVT